MSNIQTWRQALNHKLGLYQHAILRVKDERLALRDAEESVENLLGAQQLFQNTAQQVQQQAHSRIAGVVTKCLAMVWEDPYHFKIAFEQKRGKTEAGLSFYRDGHEVDPLKAAGGGMADVASFALRVSCLSLRLPRLRPLIVLDEPFRFVAADRRPMVRAMLEVLAAELGFQFVLVTHQEELKIGTVIQL